MDVEQSRLEEARTKQVPWRKWGPYLSDRQWGTGREVVAKLIQLFGMLDAGKVLEGGKGAAFTHGKSESGAKT